MVFLNCTYPSIILASRFSCPYVRPIRLALPIVRASRSPLSSPTPLRCSLLRLSSDLPNLYWKFPPAKRYTPFHERRNSYKRDCRLPAGDSTEARFPSLLTAGVDGREPKIRRSYPGTRATGERCAATDEKPTYFSRGTVYYRDDVARLYF